VIISSESEGRVREREEIGKETRGRGGEREKVRGEAFPQRIRLEKTMQRKKTERKVFQKERGRTRTLLLWVHNLGGELGRGGQVTEKAKNVALMSRRRLK